MEISKREKLQAAGFAVGDAGDFLELADEERALVEVRLAAGRVVRRLREEQGMTQADLAKKLGSSQPRIVRIEAGAADVSLDLSLKAVFALGGSLRDVEPAGRKISYQGSSGTSRKKRSRRNVTDGKDRATD